MLLLITFLLGAMSISFLCSILESVLLSTPMSFVTMKEDEGYKSHKFTTFPFILSDFDEKFAQMNLILYDFCDSCD